MHFMFVQSRSLTYKSEHRSENKVWGNI